MTRRRTSVVALLAFAVAIPLTMATGSAATASRSGGERSPASGIQATINWKPCRDVINEWPAEEGRTECGTVRVPLDYAAAQGRTIDLMVTRLKASDPAKRRGVLLLNPGGPGNQGIDMPLQVTQGSLAGVGAAYDLIGFDPRGVGYSAGKACDINPALDGPSPDPKASREAQFRQGYAQTARHNARCVGYDPAFLGSLTTNNVAADMDRIRVALGEQKISFYGISWGTALGAVYRSRFDERVDRMLLDSVMPPEFSMREMNQGPVDAADAQFVHFAHWLAARDSKYSLGRTRRQVTDTVVRLSRRLNAEPLTVTGPAGRPVTYTGAELSQIVSYPPQRWTAMAASIKALQAGKLPPLTGDPNQDTNPGTSQRSAGTRRPTTAATTGHGAGLVDTRRSDAAAAIAGLVDTPRSGILMQVAVLCNDQGPEPDATTLWMQDQERRHRSPLFGGFGGYQSWCAGWPLPARPWPGLTAGRSQLQLVGHRYEYNTPYRWAEAMQRRTGGSLLTVNDEHHASFGYIACGRKGVDFFLDGRAATGSCSGEPMK